MGGKISALVTVAELYFNVTVLSLYENAADPDPEDRLVKDLAKCRRFPKGSFWNTALSRAETTA